MPHRQPINIGQIPPPFCNKYYINKSHSVQIAPTWGQNTNQNPQGGDAIDGQISRICPPLWGLTLIGALPSRVCNVCVNMFTCTNIDLHAYIIKLGPQ